MYIDVESISVYFLQQGGMLVSSNNIVFDSEDPRRCRKLIQHKKIKSN